jgi:hypothetical protein
VNKSNALFILYLNYGTPGPGAWVQCGEILYLNTLNSLPARSLSYKYNRWKDRCTVQAQPFDSLIIMQYSL